MIQYEDFKCTWKIIWVAKVCSNKYKYTIDRELAGAAPYMLERRCVCIHQICMIWRHGRHLELWRQIKDPTPYTSGTITPNFIRFPFETMEPLAFLDQIEEGSPQQEQGDE